MSLIRPMAGWPACAAPNKPGEWFVIRTRTRQEKILARELNGAGITAYLLVVCESRTYDERPLDVEVPLFKRAVFVHGTAEELRFATSTGRVVSVARASDQLGLQADIEMLAATLPAAPPPATQRTDAAELTERPRVELHREVIGRLRRELETTRQTQMWS
jgi:hypothetical protein